ncbi:MAG TPA: solute carrier family 23 protein, partial [Bacteriovoracaceae bacterium]|nr:solute carrier family 23 protein [Bacteriovoracaceae bacterium]
GLTLIIKQLPLALGTDFTNFKISFSHILISSISLITITAWDKFNFRYNYLSFIPSALLAVAISICLNLGLNLFSPEDLVSIPDNLFTNISLTLPSFYNFNFPMILGALTIAIVASLESLLCIDAADKIDPEKRTTNKNQELIAQGIGNTLCGLIGALPVTAVIVRTTANIGAGAKTKWSSIIHGLWLLLFISLGTSVLNKVPLATLAVILLIVGFRLNRPSLYRTIYKKGFDQFFVFCVTIIAILSTDLLYGIFIGLLVSLILEARFFKNKVLFQKEGLIKQLTFKGRTPYLSRLKVYDVFTHLEDEEKLLIESCEDMHPDVLELILELKARFPERIELSGNKTVKTDS